jgi:hypothetical protein
MSYSWGASRNAARADEFVANGPPLRAVTAAAAPAETAAAADPGPSVGFEMRRLAAELAPMVDVWQRLLAQHVPDRSGRCRVCTKGGTGLPTLQWPCSIHGIAELAQRRHESDMKKREARG